jgi:selenophosphate synthase
VLGERLAIDRAIDEARVGLLFEAETSGGLLFSVAKQQAIDVARGAAERGEEFAEIGEVVGEPAIHINR